MPRSPEDNSKTLSLTQPPTRPRRKQRRGLDDLVPPAEDWPLDQEDVVQHNERSRRGGADPGFPENVEPLENLSPPGRIVVGSPPRELYDHPQRWPGFLSNGQRRQSQGDQYSLAASPPRHLHPAWSNSSPGRGPASLAGSPPNFSLNGTSPPWNAPSSWARNDGQLPMHRKIRSESQPRGPDSGICTVDTMDIGGTVETIVVSAKDSLVEVQTVENSDLQLLGRLVAVGGTVLSAKVLPKPGGYDALSHLRPLVAIVLLKRANLANQDTNKTEASSTVVEIHSLKSGAYVCQLYESPSVTPFDGPFSWNLAPEPSTSELQIQASGKFICLASAISGELFMFTMSDDSLESREHFRCIGKFWTVVTSADQGLLNQPIFSLSSRWLCILPPGPQARQSIQGTVPISESGPSPFNVESVTAPPMPSVDCVLEVPDPESFANKVAKGVAQEVFKGAQWVGNQGLQAINNYWSKSPGTSPESVDDRGHGQAVFPPTHANSNSSPQVPPAVVSIVDLEHLVHPPGKGTKKVEAFATFTLPSGCSFVSFDPSGLALFTVNGSGDSQQLWSLMKTSSPRGERPGTSAITQVARFSRFTHARVVDVVWSKPRANKIAMITERGTIHVLSVPSVALSWPPPRPHSRGQDVEGGSSKIEPSCSAHAEVSQLPLRPESMLGSAASAIRKRSSSGVSSLFNGLNNGFASFNVKDGRRIVTGMGKTASAAVGSLRPTDEVRFRVAVGSRGLDPSSIDFFSGLNAAKLAAITDGSLHIYDLSTGSSKASVVVDIKIPREYTGLKPLWKPRLIDKAPDTNTLHPLSCAEIDTGPSLKPFFADTRLFASHYREHPSHLSGPGDPWYFGVDVPTRPLENSPTSSDSELPSISSTRADTTQSQTRTYDIDTSTRHDTPEAQTGPPRPRAGSPEDDTLLGDLDDSALLGTINDQQAQGKNKGNDDDEDEDYANWHTNWNADGLDAESEGERDLLR